MIRASALPRQPLLDGDTRLVGTKQKLIKRNNLICVNQILWYIRFTL
jgi:hypothetical protein